MPPSPCACPRKCSLQLRETGLPTDREEQTRAAPPTPALFCELSLRPSGKLPFV